jgi:hypothetical protein
MRGYIDRRYIIEIHIQCQAGVKAAASHTMIGERPFDRLRVTDKGKRADTRRLAQTQHYFL